MAAAAAGATTEDQMFWYDGLQQVYQRQRGTLTPSTPPYTGITILHKPRFSVLTKWVIG